MGQNIPISAENRPILDDMLLHKRCVSIVKEIFCLTSFADWNMLKEHYCQKYPSSVTSWRIAS